MALLSQAVPRKIIYESQYPKYDIKIKNSITFTSNTIRINRLIKFNKILTFIMSIVIIIITK